MPSLIFNPPPELVSAIDACRGSLTRAEFIAVKIRDALAGDLPVFAHRTTTKSRPSIRIHLDQTTITTTQSLLTLLDMRPNELLRRIIEAACPNKLTNIAEAHIKPTPKSSTVLERPKRSPYQKPAERPFIPLSEIIVCMDRNRPLTIHARRQSGPLKIEQEPLTEAQLEVYTKLCAELCESIDPREPTEEELEQLLAKATQG